MKRRGWIAAALLLCVSAAWGFGRETIHGEGPAVEKEIDAGGVREVILETIGVLSIEQGDEEKLIVKAEKNILEHLRFKKEEDRLVIGAKGRVDLDPNKPVRYTLTVKRLDRLGLRGSGDALLGDMTTEEFRVESHGSGDVKGEKLSARTVSFECNGSGDLSFVTLRAEEVSLKMNGSGDGEFSRIDASEARASIRGSGDVTIGGGETEILILSLHGSGEFEAGNLKSGEADVKIHGSGNATIRADERVDATLHGSGDLRIQGDAKVKSRVHGSGNVYFR